MIKKIQVRQLRVGMYVSDFNAGWLDHPFVLNSMKIDSDEQVQKVLASGVKELFINTARGLDIDDAPSLRKRRRRPSASSNRSPKAGKRRFPSGRYRWPRKCRGPKIPLPKRHGSFVA